MCADALNLLPRDHYHVRTGAHGHLPLPSQIKSCVLRRSDIRTKEARNERQWISVVFASVSV